jgi:hypothetical protein
MIALVLKAALARAASPRGLSALIKKLKVPLKKVKAFAKVSEIAEGSLEAELTEDPKNRRTCALGLVAQLFAADVWSCD